MNTKWRLRKQITICLSNSVPRLSPWDVDIRSKAFSGTGLFSRLSTTRFFASCRLKDDRSKASRAHAWSTIWWSKMIIIYPRLIEDCIHIIKTNICCFKARWLISFSKPFILEDLWDCDALHYKEYTTFGAIKGYLRIKRTDLRFWRKTTHRLGVRI